MTRVAINPGRVEWSGENPGIYLKDDPDADYCTLALFFRVVLSPYGRGCAAIVLGAPDADEGWPREPNLIMTDNQRMMRWIVDGFVRKMPTFVGRRGLDAMAWLDLARVERDAGDFSAGYAETLHGADVSLELKWADLGPPLPVEVTMENSATKAHEMYSVFLEAQRASVVLNGTALRGTARTRPFFGRTMSTAFLAFSETWVTPAGAP